VRISAGLSSTLEDVERALGAVRVVATTPAPVRYEREAAGGDYWPADLARPGTVPGADSVVSAAA
jgi:hypothetical protein